ncbi:interferon-induced protein with tetratricopeptide repeats 2 [Perognathus longimembris pacificus]|uniref:interferon-induced protein with tetratricopeptide repeats 2 n=1 Tax=Perognathus longimembris pacificus TaxID=214514 RepID=UPI0020198C24|nr:interferon-induced protein with tetratricopeptide repeats 2 [Perognathus longimembris pacificus]
MSKATKKSLESRLHQLKCHFTWNLLEGESSLDEFEDRVFNQHEFQNSEFKATMCNILAFIKHHRGQNEAALEYLGQAEEFIQTEHAAQAEIRSLVTWGNYAWVHYHMGQLSEAQTYVDRVKEVCTKFSCLYKIESPELDCEEGWTLLKCPQKIERAKACFQKALEKKAKHPESTSGWAIASYRLDRYPPAQFPVHALRRAIELNPGNQYVKVLLGIELQNMNEDEGQELVEEAIKKAPGATDVLLRAAKFYQSQGAIDKEIGLLRKALECMPNNAYLHYRIGCCYKSEVLQMNTREKAMNRKRRKFLELTEKAIHHLRKAEDLNVNFVHVGSYLASIYANAGQYKEADFYFQKEFSKELAPVPKQLLHLRYGNFQLYQMKREDKAIQQFIEGVKIKQKSKAKEKMKSKLQKLAQTRLSRNEADVEAQHVLAFLQELDGEAEQIDEDSEIVANSESHAPSTSLDEMENED